MEASERRGKVLALAAIVFIVFWSQCKYIIIMLKFLLNINFHHRIFQYIFRIFAPSQKMKYLLYLYIYLLIRLKKNLEYKGIAIFGSI